MQRAFGWAQRGGLSVVEDLSGGTEVVQESFPSCTVTVYDTGTVTLSTIFDDSLGATPKANPFTASSTAYWFFYAANGTYDVRFSGTGIDAPFTLGGYLLDDFADAVTTGNLTVAGTLHVDGAATFDAAATFTTSAIFKGSDPWFDVRAYGAVGNGVADDTAAVQAAIDACEAAGGGTVFFPPGTYNLTAILSVDASCVRFIGAGVSSVVSQTTNNLGVVSIANAVNDIEIAGLYLKSASGAVTQAGRGVIYANPVGGASGVSRLDIHHCRIDAGSTCGISGNGFIDSKIHDNHIDNLGTGEHGIYLSSAGIDSTRTIVSNNTITSSDLTGDYGVCIRGCTFIEVYGNEITGFAGSVISGVGTGTDDLSVHDNKLKSPGYDGWINFEAASDRNSIINNQITSAGRNGIRTDVELYDSLIVGNLITLPAASGMRFNGLTRSSIINNVFVDCDSDSNGAGGDDSSGIRLNSSNPNNTITGNVVISSNVANFHKYCLSVSGTGNTGNRCYNNDFRAARSAPLDIDGSATWVLPINGFSTALATTAVDGFLYVPTCAGTPTGVPTVVTGMAPLVFDTSNNKLYVYDGGWVDVT